MKIFLICAFCLIVGDSVCGDEIKDTLTKSLEEYALNPYKDAKSEAVLSAIDEIVNKISNDITFFSKPEERKNEYGWCITLFSHMNQPTDLFCAAAPSNKAFIFIYFYGEILPIISSDKLRRSKHPSDGGPQYVKDLAQAMYIYETKNLWPNIKTCLKELRNSSFGWIKANIKTIKYLFELANLPENNNVMSEKTAKDILISASIKVLDALLVDKKDQLLVVWPLVNSIHDKYSDSDMQLMRDNDYNKLCTAALTLAHYIHTSNSVCTYGEILKSLVKLIALSGNKRKRDETFFHRYRLFKEMPKDRTFHMFEPIDLSDDAKNLAQKDLTDAINLTERKDVKLKPSESTTHTKST